MYGGAPGSSWPVEQQDDLHARHTNGIELLRILRERAPDTDVVLMSAFDDMPTVVAAMPEGATEFLPKP